MNPKSLFIIAFFLANGISLNAQRDGFAAGVLFHLNGIGLLGNSGDYWNSSRQEGAGHGGLTIGISVKRNISEKMYASLEISYATKGSLFKYNDPYGIQSYELLHLNYIEFPLLMGYKVKPFDRDLYFETGLAYARLVHSSVEADKIRTGTPDVARFNKNDLVWIGSVKFPLVKKWDQHFLIGIAVSRSVFSIHKDYKIYNLEYGMALNFLFN